MEKAAEFWFYVSKSVSFWHFHVSKSVKVCINYSLHKVGLHLRGDKHFEILYQCIQTLQNSLRMYELHDEVLSSS